MKHFLAALTAWLLLAAPAAAQIGWSTSTNGSAYYNSALQYGVVMDGYHAWDGSITASSSTFSSTSKNCNTSTDIGKVITISGAGAVDSGGALDPLVTTISGCSGNSFTLAAAATTTQSTVSWAYGTDNAVALQKALTNSPRGIVYLPPGEMVLNSSAIKLYNNTISCALVPNNNSDQTTNTAIYGTTILLTSMSIVPFYVAPAVRVTGCNFYWPGQTGIAQNPGTYPAQPWLAPTTGGSLSAGTYYGEITYVFAAGEGPRSVEVPVTVASSGEIVVHLPSFAGTVQTSYGATGWNFYLGATSGSEELQNATPTAIGTTTLTVTSLTTGTAAPPAPFVPVVFPPLFESNGSFGKGGVEHDVFDHLFVINAYQFFVQCNASADPVATCTTNDGAGDLRFADSSVYAIYHAFDFNNTGETTWMENFHFNPSIFTQPAESTNNIAGNLATWTSENADFMNIEGNGNASGSCATGAANIQANNLTVEVAKRFIHVSSGSLEESMFDGTVAVETIVQVDAAGAAQGTNRINAEYLPVSSYTSSRGADAFSFNSTCSTYSHPGFDISGQIAQGAGTFVDIQGTLPYVVHVGPMTAYSFGNSQSVTGATYYFGLVNNSSALLQIDGVYLAPGNSSVKIFDAAAGTIDVGSYNVVGSAGATYTGSGTFSASGFTYGVCPSGSNTTAMWGNGTSVIGFCAGGVYLSWTNGSNLNSSGSLNLEGSAHLGLGINAQGVTTIYNNAVAALSTSVGGGVNLPNIATTANVGTDVLCWNNAGGAVTAETTVALCEAASLMSLKNFKEWMDDKTAIYGIDKLRPVAYTYKDQKTRGGREQVGLYAEDVAKMDPRCGVYDHKGKLHSWDERCVISYLVGAMQAQQAEIAVLQGKVK
jgi:hypothetical protein